MSFGGRDGRGGRDQRDQGTQAGLWRPFHALVMVPRGRSEHSGGFCVPKCWRPRPWGGKGNGPPGPPGNGDTVGTPQFCWRSQFHQCPLHPLLRLPVPPLILSLSPELPWSLSLVSGPLGALSASQALPDPFFLSRYPQSFWAP